MVPEGIAALIAELDLMLALLVPVFDASDAMKPEYMPVACMVL
jgi:hypothetical protein